MTELQSPPRRPQDMGEEEWRHRVELATCYRVFDLLGWTALIYNHISLRLPGDADHLLINPFGLTYAEVTPENLVKIDLDGNVIEPSEWTVNLAGLIIHSAVHAARPDVKVVMHTHTTAGSVVAGLRDGLDWNNFYSAQLHGHVAYHGFEGATTELGEKERLTAALGSCNLLILRNHGLLACGPTIPAAWFLLWTLQRACDVQVATFSTGRPIMEITDEARRRSAESVMRVEGHGRAVAPGLGELAYAALCRQVPAFD
ncbi:MAG: class II aldolase/adducin family protein [Solirubrobacteraceae bacterium]